MYEERCFICGGRMGKGMHPSLGSQEKIDKLVSVSRNVSHTSTIICDILSRILNETVMEDESICKICFNLLNDIDYHLKEAQEKTDEVTNKFLDKNRENKYVEQQSSMVEEILPETRAEQRSSKKRVSSPPKKHSVFMPRNHHHHEDHDVNLTEDEMSVNSINKNKAKLLSHVLNPKMKSKMIQKQQKEEENTTTPMPTPMPTTPKSSSKKGSNKRPISKRYIASSSESEDEINDEESDQEMINQVKKKSKKDELTTVNMEDLGDLFSKPNMYYAKKSSPKKAAAVTTAQDNPNDDRNPITCELCKKTFKKLINLQLHLEKVHEINSKPVVLEQESPPESYKCLQCTREFVSEEALMKHVDEHINETAKPVEKKPVARNLQPAKDNEVKATCPQCNQTFRRLFNMKTHINRVHNKVKPYKCDKCDKSFATNSDLKQHLNTHGEGKLFKCDLCDRTFTNRDSIILHKKQHNQEKTHFCSLCLKGFYKASCLTRHMRSHTGERPYRCEVCNKGFSQSTTLKVHMHKCAKSTPSATQDPLTITS